MKKISAEWLREHNACTPREEWKMVDDVYKGDVGLITRALINAERYADASWLVTRCMTKHQCVRYAIFAAEQVPQGGDGSRCIAMAKAYLTNPCERTKNAATAATAAATAGYTIAATTAATAAATAGARVTSTAADYAIASAHASAGTAAAEAAYDATSTAATSTAAACTAAYRSAYRTAYIKIIENGLGILW